MLIEAWRTTPDEYERIVQYFNKEFQSTFYTFAPLQILGDFWGRSKKILLVTDKPTIELTQEYRNFENLERGFEALQGKREGFTWVNQLLFSLNYFKLLRKNNLTNKYYDKLDKLVQFYEGSSEKIRHQYDLLQDRVIQIHFIPFYTNSLVIRESNPIVEGSFRRIKKYFLENKLETMIINETLFNTLVDSDLISKMEYIELDQSENNPDFSLIEFTLENDKISKKGLVVQDIDSMTPEKLQKISQKLHELSNWNKNNSIT